MSGTSDIEALVRLANLIVNLIGVAIVPFIIYVIKASTAKRAEENRAIMTRISDSDKKTELTAVKISLEARVQTDDIQKRLDRIENGTVERMIRLEAKIDTHLQWHLMQIGHSKLNE